MVPDLEPLFLIFLAAIVGILISDHWYLAPWKLAALVLVSAGLVVSFSALIARKGSVVAQICICLLAALSFGTSHQARVAHARGVPGLGLLNEGAAPMAVSVDGVIVSAPRVFAGGKTTKATVRVDSLRISGKEFALRHRVPVTLRTSTQAVDYGDEIKFSGELMLTKPARNPGAFSPEAFYRRNPGSHVEIVSGMADRLTVVAHDRANPVVALGLSCQSWLAEAITAGLDDQQSDEASVLKAVILGARESTPEAVEDGFRFSGALHIFAVSGLHVGIFGGAVWFLLRLMRVHLSVSVWIVIVAVLFYALVTGLRPPAVRAALMMTIVLLGMFSKSRARMFNSLSFAGLVILAFDSHQIFQAGFQLSFAVLASILLLAPPLLRGIERLLPVEGLIPVSLKSRWTILGEKVALYFANSVAVSLAAMLGSLPIILYHFQLATPISVITNLVVVIFAAGMIWIGATSALASVIHLPLLPTMLNGANAFIAKATIGLTGLLASVPGGHFYVSPFESDRVLEEETCRLTVLDTQDSGAAILVEVAGKVILFDTGGDFSFRQALGPLLRERGINRIDHLFLSHLDANHIGAATEVIRQYRVGRVWMVDLERPSQTGREALLALSEKGVAYEAITAHQRLQISHRTAIRVLFPDRENAELSRADDRSAVLQLRHAGRSVLMGFDLGGAAESWIMDQTIGLESDILIRGWHAEDYAGLEDFHEAVSPQLIISRESEGFRRVTIPTHVRQWALRENVPLIDQSDADVGAVEVMIDADGEMDVRAFLDGEIW